MNQCGMNRNKLKNLHKDKAMSVNTMGSVRNNEGWVPTNLRKKDTLNCGWGHIQQWRLEIILSIIKKNHLYHL